MRLARLGIDADEIDGARSSRRGADVRQLLAEQRIDQAGLADVGPAKKSEFRRTFRGKEPGVGSGSEEFGEWLHLFLSLRSKPLESKMRSHIADAPDAAGSARKPASSALIDHCQFSKS